MAVAIRLSRVGTKHVPFSRIVVVDSRKKRDGEVLENIGTYDALKSKIVTFKPERYDAWVQTGAQPSDTVKKIYRLFKKQAVVAKPEVDPKKNVEAKAAKASKSENAVAEKTTEPNKKDTSQE